MKEVYTLNLREGELLSFNGKKRGYALAENITSVGMCLHVFTKVQCIKNLVDWLTCWEL